MCVAAVQGQQMHIHPSLYFFLSPARTQQAENWGVDDKERPQTSLELLHNGLR